MIAVLVILYAALYLRGLDFGKPVCEHSDEWVICDQAMQMVAKGPFHNLQEYGYGSLSIFIQSGVCAFVHAYNNAFGVYRDAEGKPLHKNMKDIVAKATDRDRFCFYYVGRCIVACYAGILFWLMYRLTSHLFANRAIAFLCVLATMLNPLMVQQAHFALPNVLGTLLALAAIYCSLVFLEKGDKRVLYLGVMFAGLAVGAKITMVWALPVVAFAAFLRLGFRSIKHAPFLLLAFVAIFLLLEPYIISDWRNFYDDYAREARNYSGGTIIDSRDFQSTAFGSKTGCALAAKWRFLNPLLYLGYQSWSCFAVSLLGITLLPFSRGKKGVLILLFPLLALVFLGMQRKVLTTNYLPLIPFLALGVGSTAFYVLQRTKRRSGPNRRVAMAVLLLLLWMALAVPAGKSYGVVRQFTTQDPCQTSLAWIESNVPKNASVLEDFGMRVVFPFTNDGMDVQIAPFAFFWKPYTDFLKNDYVVALTPGLYDRFEWFQSLLSFVTKDPLLRETCLRNRRLNEQRLMLARRVTPEECGYVPYAEMPFAAYDVSIYKVPKITPVRVSAPQADQEGKHRWDATVGHQEEVRLQLGAGHCDVFVNTTRELSFKYTHVSLGVQMDDQTPRAVDILDARNADHYVTTINLEAPKEVLFRLNLLTPLQKTDEHLWINAVVCVPTTGNAIP